MDQPSVYEKSLRIIDSEHILKQVLISSIIYSASYYPLTQDWLNKIINKCCHTADQQVLLEAVQLLIDDLNRQIIYGPSASYVVVSEKPHKQHLDSCFIREQIQIKQNNLVDLAKKIVKQSWISEFIQQHSIQQLLWYRRSNYLKLTNFINIKVNASVLKQLEVNGQSWIKTTSLPTLFLTVKSVLKNITKNQQINPKFFLYLGRLSFLHNKILQNPSKQLADDSLTNFRKYIAIVNKNHTLDLINYVCLLLEYINVLLFYYKYSQCERVLDFCKSITNLQLEYTGKMGRRTKYQSFDTAQLVMNIKEKSKQQKPIIKNQNDNQQYDKDAIVIPDAKQLVLKQIQANPIEKNSHIETSHFDEQNILLEKPQYVQQQKQQQKIPIHKILVTLSIIQYMWETTPKDQILYQQVATSIQTILQHQQKLSYPILFNVLLLRSLNQFPRAKNVQRALDQLEKLKKNFNEKTQKNINYLYASSYVPYFQFIKTIAQKYMEIGMTMTAVQLYQKVGMIQECIDGLIAKNYKQKAQALAVRYQKQYGKTPRLLCMLGDLEDGDKCIQLYQQAWNLSDKRNARCQRSLGWHYFRKKEYLRAAEAFRKATQANFYHPNTWFTLGCCFMQLQQFQRAIPAFGQCVCIDETQGQAWGNIATCYIHQNRFKQAYSTLQQALKHSEKSWKMWSNMLTISLKIKKFYKYFQCIQKLVTLQKSQLINSQMLKKLITIFQYQQDTAQRRRLIQSMKNRLDRVYNLLVQKIGQNPIVWASIYQYNLELQHYTTQNYKHYKKLHQQGKIDKNDLLQGFQTIQQMNKFVNQTLYVLKDNIVTSKQTQLNMTMKVGWQTNKKLCEEITKLLQQYVITFEKYGDTQQQKSVNEFKLFVKGVQKKIQVCLEKPVQIKFTK